MGVLYIVMSKHTLTALIGFTKTSDHDKQIFTPLRRKVSNQNKDDTNLCNNIKKMTEMITCINKNNRKILQ